MKNLKFILLILLAIILNGCQENDDYFKEDILKIYNNSDKDVYFRGKGDTIQYNYPPNESFLITAHNYFEETSTYNEALANGKKIYFWIYDREIVDQVPWEEVKKNNMYLVRCEFTLQDLKNMNWEVVYEGN